MSECPFQLVLGSLGSHSKASPLISSPVLFPHKAKIRLQDVLKAGVSVSVPAIGFLKPRDDRCCHGHPTQGI